MLWARYALLGGKPWIGLEGVYRDYLESPGTKAYTVEEALALFDCFESVRVRPILSFGDLLLGEVGQRHRGALLTFAKRLYPRALIRYASRRFDLGLYLLIDCRK